jgi:branched-chain amino acid transport system ATP-binding protein
MSAPTPTAGAHTAAIAEPVLELESVNAGYGATAVLRDVSFSVLPGQIVALLGANGAGKTTTLRVASGLLRPTTGTVRVFGTHDIRPTAHRRARNGVCLIPEGRGIFRSLSVRDNLRLYGAPAKRSLADATAVALDAFPALKGRLNEPAGRLSGGQQQMVALARAYVAQPRLILVDEVSLGLAPLIVDEIFTALATLAAQGTSMLLVEQYVQRALGMTDHVVLMNRGTITYSGPAEGLDEQAIVDSYLGS